MRERKVIREIVKKRGSTLKEKLEKEKMEERKRLMKENQAQ